MFAQDATPSQLSEVASALETSLGSQAAFLDGVVPNLAKLVSYRSIDGASAQCIDPAASMQFLFRKLLQTLSQHRRVTFFLSPEGNGKGKTMKGAGKPKRWER